MIRKEQPVGSSRHGGNGPLRKNLIQTMRSAKDGELFKEETMDSELKKLEGEGKGGDNSLLGHRKKGLSRAELHSRSGEGRTLISAEIEQAEQRRKKQGKTQKSGLPQK